MTHRVLRVVVHEETPDVDNFQRKQPRQSLRAMSLADSLLMRVDCEETLFA